MQWSQLLLALGPLAAAQQMMRFQCSQLVIERMDPLVEPGNVQSGHLHQIVGGDSFNASMPPIDYDPSTESRCTSCTFAQDFSNYWTANLFFRSRNGTLKRVEQFVNLGLRGEGGVTVYYIPPYQRQKTVTAFPKGFRMLAGDPSNRSPDTMERQICHRCFANMQQNPFGGAPCTGRDTAALPAGKCGGGIRSTITFPTCWDGKNVDTPNHKDHMAYPLGTFEQGSPCPASHPVAMPQVMYEVMWDTTPFNNEPEWADGQPFVYSFGDTTGYGQHGDYLFGWEGDSLQKALDARCNLDRCAQLEFQQPARAVQCQKPQTVPEQTEGWLPELPGRMRIE